ncbi:TonB-dependent receptor [Neokomagataea sp. TBRC 2177]|uniref:TonB-dependent receptor n=2 Tax=Neokomagataea anthophila TaxID=2826925 RepID=A0ABS5E9X2_9PROT|nr:TonB-dependent receptor [Neokomagataea anthophila]
MFGKKRLFLLCSTAMLLCDGVSAQPLTAKSRVVRESVKKHTHVIEGSVLGPAVPQVEEISVSGVKRNADGVSNTTPGGGLMPHQTAPRSQSGVTRDFIAKQAPTGNVSSMVANLPGVTFASQDPLGVTGDTLTMRGFNESQIGYLFEGAPLADPINYEPYTSMLVDTENLASVTVSQGSPDLNAPLFNATGGEISATALNPSHHAGGFVSAMGGTHSANKEFLRLETGDIGQSGIRGFVSFSHLSNNNWRGPGGLKRYHIDAKFIKEWGDDNSITAIFGYNKQQQTAWVMPTAAQWEQSKASVYYSPHYTPGDPSYYKLNFSGFNALDVVLPMHFTLSDEVHLNVTPYFVHQHGPAVNGENIPASGGYNGTLQYGNLNQPYVMGNTLTTASVDPWDQSSSAINSSVSWTHGNNNVTFGYWYSWTTHQEVETFTPVNSQGKAANLYGSYPIFVPQTGTILSGFNLNFKQQVNTLFIADTLKLLDNKLTLSAGFRAAMVWRSGTNNVYGAEPYKTVGNYFEPLPQFAASYQITPHDQVYVNGTTSFRAPQSVESYSQLFDPNSSTAVEQPGVLKSEYDISEEIGYRHSGRVNVQVSLFNSNMTNHQVTSSGYIPFTHNLVAEPINIGGQTSRGAQIEVGLRPWHHFSPYVSAQYLHATIDNNVAAAATNAAGAAVIDYLPTTGKHAVDSPSVTTSVGLSYDDGHFFGNFDLRYQGKMYSTFMNDQSIPGYVVSDMTVGYRFNRIGAMIGPKMQLNLINLGNNIYRSIPASSTGTAVSQKGIYGNTVAAGAPVYQIGGNFAALFSVSTGF